jgi:hypothetical protein
MMMNLLLLPLQEARDSISAYQSSRAAAEEQQREAERAPVREVRPLSTHRMLLPHWQRC